MNKAKFAAGLLAVGITAMTAIPAFAVTFDNRPKILLHVRSVTTKNICTFGVASLPTDCSNAASTTQKGELTTAGGGGGGFYFLYLLAARGNQDGLAGLQCGIAYENNEAGDDANSSSIDVYSWNLCAQLQFPTPAGPTSNVWPKPKGGNLITWDRTTNCQVGDVAVAGYFYMGAYAPAPFFQITARPVDGVAKVANCTTVNAETNLLQTDLGFAQFSAGATTAGCNPCVQICNPVAVETTTWGGIKSLYSR